MNAKFEGYSPVPIIAWQQAGRVRTMVQSNLENTNDGRFQEVFPGIGDRYGGRWSAYSSVQRAAASEAIDASIIVGANATDLGVATVIQQRAYGPDGTTRHDGAPDSYNIAYWTDRASLVTYMIESDLRLHDVHADIGRSLIARAISTVGQEAHFWALLTDGDGEPSSGLRNEMEQVGMPGQYAEDRHFSQAIDVVGPLATLYELSPTE